jgi:hypothetical protein
MTDPSVPAVIEMVDVALRSYFLTPASKPKLTNSEEVQEAIRGLTFSKAPGPNGMPSPSHHIKLALYADDTAIIAMSRKPTLLISYLESYLNDLQW